MDKRILERQMTGYVKGAALISPNKLRGFLGAGPNTVSKLVDGLDYLEDDKGRKYFVSDVTERILERRRRS